MIKNTELRLGNYVQDTVSGEWMIVDELGKSVGATLINRDKYPLPDGWQMGYIPLTPEVMKKCGFKKGRGKHNDQWELNVDIYLNFRLHEEDYSLEIFDKEENSITPYCEHLKNLHTLQNLYFALTGEELEINL